MFNISLRLSNLIGAVLVSGFIQIAAAASINTPALICSGKNDSAPVYLLKDAQETLTRMEVTANKDGSYLTSYVKVSIEELLAECANGVSIAALPARQVDGLKDGVPTQSSLPASFTIMTSTTIACKYGQPPPSCRRAVWGNFWVPGSMPASDNAHIAQFDLAQSGFNNSSSGTHFVHSLLTVSNSSFAADFQGKGLILGVADACGGNYSSVLQTSQNNSDITAPGTTTRASNISGVWGQAMPSTVNTCYTLSPTDNYRFLVRADHDQATVYYVYPNGFTTPTVLPTVTATEQFFWRSQSWGTSANSGYTNPYSSYSYSGTGASGVAFFVAGFVPIPSTEVWSLTFSDASSVTQP